MIDGTVLLSAGLAGLVASAVTAAIERWGGRVGGLLGTMPSTIVPAAAGIALSAGEAELRAAMAVAPAGMLLNVLFLWLWRLLPPRLPAWTPARRLAAVLVASLTAWGLAALLLTVAAGRLRASGQPLEPLGLLLTLVIGLLGLTACWRAPAVPGGRRAVGPAVHLARGLVAGGAVGLAVWFAARGGAVAAGVAAVFPAIFLTTMVALWLAQGEAVQAGAVGPMMLGATSVAAYSLLAGRLLPALGLGWGSLASWTLAVGVVTLPAWRYTRWRAQHLDLD